MGVPSLIESFELLRFSETFQVRLKAAREELEARRGFEREKQWMVMADEMLALDRRPAPPLLERARCLPELAEAALELASDFQETWVDSLEKLMAGIMFHAGSRSPVIEAVFPHQKFPALRRATKEAVMAYCAEFERRLKTGYVTRMMQGAEFSFVQAVREQISAAYATWYSCYVPPPVPEEEAARLREELPVLAKKVDRTLNQARLLAEAALLPFGGAYDSSGLNAKPRRRARADGVENPFAEEPLFSSEEATGLESTQPPEDEPSDSQVRPVEPEAAAPPPAANTLPAGKPPPAVNPQPAANPQPAKRAPRAQPPAEVHPKAKRSKKSSQMPEA